MPEERSGEPLHCKVRAYSILRPVIAIALSVLLLSSTLVVASADDAWADVRRTDSLVGRTVEERGISALQCPSVDAEFAIVVDDNGTVYFDRDALSATQIASVTKIMTALVVLNLVDGSNGALTMETPITVSAQASMIGESSAQLLEGDVLTIEDALKALMIPSGNDAAEALAENLGRYVLGEEEVDSENAQAAFVALMNATATDLGCVDTFFTNPHGLDSDAYAGDLHSTAADVAKISSCAMQNETFRDIVSMGNTSITVTREDGEATLDLQSTDQLLNVYDGACGIKTGYTASAGFCFAAASNRYEDDYLYAIILDSTSDAQRFSDAQTLFDWVYDNHVSYQLAQNDEMITATFDGETKEVPIVAEVSHSDWLDKTVKATFADPDASVDVFSFNGNVSEDFEFYEVSGNVKVGDVLGCASFYQNGEVVATQDLIAVENVGAPGFFDSIGIWWHRLVDDVPSQAASIVLNDTPLIYDKQI